MLTLITNKFHKKYCIPYTLFVILTTLSFVLIILNPTNIISNTYNTKIIACIITLSLIICVSYILCIIIDDKKTKKEEEIYFNNYRSINNLSTFIFDYSVDQLPTTYGLNNS